MCKAQLFRPELIKEYASNVNVVYTPLHGTGAMHVEKVLGDLGLHVNTVPEQRNPDGNFPTVEKPNPEEKPAMKMAVELGKKENADCVMATDPDSDRFGTAFPDKKGEFVIISGNKMGALLMEYIFLSRKEFGKLPQGSYCVRSIVTSPFGDEICKKYGVEMIECLTGFKWIAAVEAEREAKNQGEYVFGLEESYGYKIEKEVMDKDGVSAAAMCAEMTMYWRSKGKSLLEHLDDMYKEYGYFEDRSISKNFPGIEGVSVMKGIMSKLRTDGLKTLGGKKVLKIRDIQTSVSYDPNSPDKKETVLLPKSNVLQFFLEGGTIVSARPSGTEPKIKFYINTKTEVGGAKCDGCLKATKEEASKLCDAIEKDINKMLDDASK